METPLAMLVLLVGGTALVVLAPLLRVPYPILVLLGGVGIGFLPGMPQLDVSPDIVLLALLPPLLYSAAFFFPSGQLRANRRPIGLLAIVVVILTTVAVAVATHLVLDLPWAPAFVLGAIVSPTDPTAVEAIAQRLRAPRDLVSIVQGESLINDAMALTIYASAVALVAEGSISAPAVIGRFAGAVVGGVAAGLAVGWIAMRVRRRIDSAPEELAISLATAYVAYLAADVVGASGVLGAVVAGLYHGRGQSRWISSSTRLQTFAFWNMLTFVINVVLFVLIGLQLPAVLDALRDRSVGELLGGAALVVAVVVLVRFAWVGSTTGALRLVEQRSRPVGALPNRYALVVAVTGMRGAVSLAAALALPREIAGGGAFAERDLLVFLTFAVIVVTLVGEGLALPTLLHRFGLDGDETAEREEDEARLEVARAARQRLDELRDEDWVREETWDRLAEIYEFREERFASRLDDESDGHADERSADYQRLRREILGAERGTLLRLRDEGRIDGDTVGRVEYDLDLEENRLAE